MAALDRSVPAARRGELDALRALVVLGLIFFHAALVFSPDDDFYVKNADTTGAVTVFAGLGVVWAMPMLFLVAGLGARHSMRRRGRAGFARERLLRLGVPLLLATLVLNPLPQWLRLRAAGPGPHESYWRFWPRFLTVHLDFGDFPFVLSGRYFETGHLWFVVLLLTFCLALAAVTGLLPRPGRGPRALPGHLPLLLLLPALPLAAVNAFGRMEEDFAGWNRWAYLVFFVCGYALPHDERVRAAMRRAARPFALLGLALFAGTAPGFIAGDDPFTAWSPLALASRALFSAAGWCLVLAILGLLDRPRPGRREGSGRGGRPVWNYLASAALPLYVLHQPVVVAVAYGIVGWSAPIPVKYALIVLGSLAVTLAGYECVVRRTRVTRFLFGMRPGAPPAGRVRGAGKSAPA